MAENGDGIEVRRRRAIFRATHRGTKEMDWVLGRFAEAQVKDMGDEELTSFEQFLALPDPDIEQWVMRGATVDPSSEIGLMVGRLRSFHRIGQ